MTITHHPAPENLLTCSAGAMPEAYAAVMASHLDICPECRREVSVLESIGGVLLADLPPAALSHLGKGASRVAITSGAAVHDRKQTDVPRPIQRFVGATLDSVKWRRIVPGIWQHVIPLSTSAKSNASLRLLKVAPGVALPDHGHSGSEMTLILQGAFRDNGKPYNLGDFIELDETAEHAPIADMSSGCICLVASEGRMKFRGLVARAAQRFLGF
jgi:putative transcriptional regulator